MIQLPPSATSLMAHLQRLSNNTGAMAELRRATIPSLRYRAWPYLGEINAIGHRPSETIAALYATYPINWPEDAAPQCFAIACKKLAAKRETKSDGESPFDARFKRLMNCEREDLYTALPGIIRGLKAASIPVDYATLYGDILYWGEKVQKHWAQYYWGSYDTTDTQQQ